MNLKELKAAETRRRFIDVAHELFLKQGYGTTSMNQIAQVAGGSRANLYLHFRNKPDLMMAKMRDIEPSVRAPILKVFELPEHTMDSIRGWLDELGVMWRDYAPTFSAMEQAMGEDETVADEWLGMMRRLSFAVPFLEGHEERRFQFLTNLMSLDRNFYFLYIRNQDTNEDMVKKSLARQWLTLFDI